MRGVQELPLFLELPYSTSGVQGLPLFRECQLLWLNEGVDIRNL